MPCPLIIQSDSEILSAFLVAFRWTERRDWTGFQATGPKPRKLNQDNHQGLAAAFPQNMRYHTSEF